MSEINLPIYGISVTLDEQGKSGTIRTTDLRIDQDEYENENYNSAMHGIEALILSCACSGIDIEDERFIEAIQTAVEGVINNI